MQTDSTGTEHSYMQTKLATVNSSSMQTEKKSTSNQLTQTESSDAPAAVIPTQTEITKVEECSMQTEEKKTQMLYTQTDIKTHHESFMQTDEKEYVNSCMQTDIMCLERLEQICQASVETQVANCQTQVECVEQDCQTELIQVDTDCQTYKDEQTRDTQTIIKEYVETDIQTDSSMSLMTDQNCQASVELSSGECQAVVQQCNGEVQAVMDTKDRGCQTRVDCKESTCQAVVVQSEFECQATSEMTEEECQATVDAIDGQSQVEMEFADIDCQASVEQRDGDCQASVEQADEDCQTSVELRDGDCQASVEQADEDCQASVEQRDGDCQASVEQVDEDCQANQDCSETESQTDASFWSLADNESQTEAHQELDDQFIPMKSGRSVCMQTEAVKIKTKISQTEGLREDVAIEAEVKEQDLPPTDNLPGDDHVHAVVPQMERMPGQIPERVAEEQMPEGRFDPSLISIINEPGVVQVGLDGFPVGGNPSGEEMPTIVSIEPVGRLDEAPPTIVSIKPVKKEEKERGDTIDLKEMSCQTDPVTIIIGDASFLVNRLKDSSAQPARVCRNEIEIEVGPDSEKKDLFNFESKRNIRRIKTEPRQGATRARIKKEKVGVPRLPDVPIPQEPEPVQRLPPPGSDELGQYSCPFCALTFHESPALYEHLQVDHGNITSSAKARTPRSSGKSKSTTRARKRPTNPPPHLEPNDVMTEPVDGGGDDHGPPILTPYRDGEYSEEAELAAQQEQEEKQIQLARERAADTVYDSRPPGEDDGPGLFEDIPEPKTKKRRGQPREIQQRNKSIFPPVKSLHSNIELDCPMCPEKFGTPDLLYLHIRRHHKEEDNSRKRIDVVNALMHDKLAETPELMPVPRSRRRRLPMVATDSSSDSPAKRRRTKEVIEQFEESLIEDSAAAPGTVVERAISHEAEPLHEPIYEEEEQRVESLVERINPEDDDEEDDHEEHLEGEEQMPSDVLENMVEVVVQEPPGEEEQEQEDYGDYSEAEDEAMGLVEAIVAEDNGIDEENKSIEGEEGGEQDVDVEPVAGEEESTQKLTQSGLRRTRHSLKGQGPPRSTPRTRGGRRH